MNTFFFIMMLVSMVAVVGVLATGLFVMSKGGDLNKKYGNKLMQWRVICQGMAIGFLILTMLTSGN